VNWKTTLVLLLLVAGLGAFVLWGDSGPTSPKESKLVLPKFKTDDVTKVAIKRGAGLAEEVVLVKDGPVWKLEKPVADKADDGKVRELLAPIEFLEFVQKKEGDEAKKAPFGDVAQRLEVSRSQDKGGDCVFEFGSAGTGDTRYLRVAGRDAVYLVKKDLADRCAWDSFDFRVKELFTLTPSDVSKLLARAPSPDPDRTAQVIELARGKDHLWRLGGADGELAEAKLVNEILEKVRATKAKGVVSDKPADAELATWGLKPPEVEVTLFDSAEKSTKTEVLQLGKKIDAAKSDERYARFVGRATVYKLEAEELVRSVSKDPSSFRTDSLFPLSATTEGVTLVSAKWKAGRTWKLVKKEDWAFEPPAGSTEPRAKWPKGEADAVKGLVKGLADLKISTREQGADSGKFGLAEPAFSITLGEGDAQRTLHVGNSAEGGVYFVRREGESRIYSTKLGELVASLENAPLGARAKQLFKASYWEMSAFKLTTPDGKALSGEKKGNDWTIEPGYASPSDVDGTKLSHAFEPLEALTAESWVAEVGSDTLAAYGLDKPTTLTVTVKSWEANTNQEKKEERTLLLGRREGDTVFALEKGAAAIGKVKAEFLDLLNRGFRRGKPLFDYVNHECFSLVVKDEKGNETARLEKRKDGLQDDWYLSGSAVAVVASGQKLVGADVQKLLALFNKIEGSPCEDAANKKARGLDPPRRTFTFQTKPAFGKDEITTKVLLIGERAGEHDLWAMDQAGSELGSMYDGPVLKVDAFLAAPPIEKKKDDDKKKDDGTAPIASPTAPNK
jgi:hypothetical protein